MGYHTDFEGEFNLNIPLTEEHKTDLSKFNISRRVKRHADKCAIDPIREAANLPIGEDACNFVGDNSFNKSIKAQHFCSTMSINRDTCSSNRSSSKRA